MFKAFYKELKYAVPVLLFASSAFNATVCGSMYHSGHDIEVKRLSDVSGDHGKKNDIVFCGERRPAESNVIFFHGDVQDYKENMLAHSDNKQFAEWDIESTAARISRRFSNSHVWVVKVSVMEFGTLSIYANFLKWKTVGRYRIVPIHETGQRSWHHLQQLISNAVSEMNACSEEETATLPRCTAADLSTNHHAIFRADLPVILIGFSKGCVVLNQLAYELAGTLKLDTTDVHNSGSLDNSARQFASLVTTFYWLDGGHSGDNGAWITQDDVLRSLVKFEINCHVTPYQINDTRRPWIGQEHAQFVAGLKKHGGRIQDTTHFTSEKRSINNHFKILEMF